MIIDVLAGLDLALDADVGLIARDDGLGCRREHVAAQRHLADVAVLADHPVAAVAESADIGRLLVPPDRCRAREARRAPPSATAGRRCRDR